MSTATETSERGPVVGALRTGLIVSGIVAVILGALILLWPGRTAQVATGIVAAYTILAGLVYAAIGITSGTRGGWSRVGHIALGVLFVVVGIVAFANLPAFTVSFALFLGVLVGVLWIVEGAVSLSTLTGAPSRGWTIAFAVLSIIAGVTLLFSPLWGALVLWWLLGISAVALGVVNVVRGITLGR